MNKISTRQLRKQFGKNYKYVIDFAIARGYLVRDKAKRGQAPNFSIVKPLDSTFHDEWQAWNSHTIKALTHIAVINLTEVRKQLLEWYCLLPKNLKTETKLVKLDHVEQLIRAVCDFYFRLQFESSLEDAKVVFYYTNPKNLKTIDQVRQSMSIFREVWEKLEKDFPEDRELISGMEQMTNGCKEIIEALPSAFS